jgi:excisionase family DNA binding protein
MESNTVATKRGPGRPRKVQVPQFDEQAQKERIAAADAASAKLPPVELRLLTINQVAEIFRVTRRTIENMIAADQIPSVKIRGARRFWPDDILRIAQYGT